MKKNCTACGIEFDALRGSKTCSYKCSQIKKFEYKSLWYAAHKNEMVAYMASYNKSHKTERYEYRIEHKKEISKHKAEYYSLHKDVILNYQAANKSKMSHDHKVYCAVRRKNDENFYIGCKLRSRLWNTLHSQCAVKSDHTMDLCGCSEEFLHGYISHQFVPGMTLHNVHVDHIIPLSAFNLKCKFHQRLACHYTNLRPMWPIDNIKKGAKVVW